MVFSGCRTEPFGCESNDQCQVDAAAGVCEANGYCSFSDPECDSGRRYSNLAGGGLAGLCVNTPAETTGPGSSSGPGTTTVTPMTGLTTELTTVGSSSSASSTTADETSTTASESTGTGTTGGLDSGSTGEPGIDDGLVVYLSFDEPPQDDEGTIPVDPGLLPASCSNISNGCPALVPGVVGMAGQFDGIDDVITVADDDRLHLQESLSMCLWARRTGSFGTDYALLAGKAFSDSGANSYEFYLSNLNEETGTCTVNFSTDSPSAFASRSDSLSNEWTHLCGVWDGEAWRLYLNGKLSGLEPLEAVPSYDANPFLVGADNEPGLLTHFFPGEIDEVRLYDRALSPDEVASLANEG